MHELEYFLALRLRVKDTCVVVMSGAKTWSHAAKLAGKLRIIKLCVKGDPPGIRAVQVAVVYGVHS